MKQRINVYNDFTLLGVSSSVSSAMHYFKQMNGCSSVSNVFKLIIRRIEK